MKIESTDVDPAVPAGALGMKMGIEMLEATPARSVARMPVKGNTQPYGILHGGPGRYAVGIEISASHSRSVSSGWVTGTCTAISLGRTLTVHEIVMTDDDGNRLSTVRMTNLLRDV